MLWTRLGCIHCGALQQAPLPALWGTGRIEVDGSGYRGALR
jgi:hypothetical protein